MINDVSQIGIFGWKTGDNSYGCSIPYMQYLNGFGNVRVITPEEPIDERFDLIVVPGGVDVDPNRYGAIPNLWTSKPDPIKEYFDTVILPQYIKLGTSVYGVCRGIQSIAVLYGAQLVQHMYHETNGEDRNEAVHEIELCDTTFKTEFEEFHGKTTKIEVNSMHHQCVSSYNFPDELEILGYYKAPNFKKRYTSSIEVLRHRTLNIFAVQYHPEELIKADPLGDYILNLLLSKTKNNDKETNS
jgi:gamma-glutamyl-gamma-aminobutyrate hydrolase PuuD